MLGLQPSRWSPHKSLAPLKIPIKSMREAVPPRRGKERMENLKSRKRAELRRLGLLQARHLGVMATHLRNLTLRLRLGFWVAPFPFVRFLLPKPTGAQF